MISPAAAAALEDRRLKRRDLVVYGLALRELSYYEPRPFKVRAVARVARVSYGDAGSSIRRLVAFGYLERGPRSGRRSTYLVRGLHIRSL